MMSECEERTLQRRRAMIEHFGPSFCSSRIGFSRCVAQFFQFAVQSERLEDFRDAVLLVERREVELELRDVRKVDVGVRRAFRLLHGMFRETLGEH